MYTVGHQIKQTSESVNSVFKRVCFLKVHKAKSAQLNKHPVNGLPPTTIALSLPRASTTRTVCNLVSFYDSVKKSILNMLKKLQLHECFSQSWFQCSLRGIKASKAAYFSLFAYWYCVFFVLCFQVCVWLLITLSMIMRFAYSMCVWPGITSCSSLCPTYKFALHDCLFFSSELLTSNSFSFPLLKCFSGVPIKTSIASRLIDE